ncbi:response regulator [Lachnotalea sp. AF33-28]|uniref:response regulator n=1 Tax=Lachnotalea sp. AF33-28 TaxID=2292046 RepID=UPI000E51F87C|nr:response regulator [Lachnotalea sp. AF33-28]RHP36505.1 response regulator [Lachnotalea sp. AF33-28]
MKGKKGWAAAALFALVTLLMIWGAFYMGTVREALWDNSVTSVMETTVQGANTLDVYLEKDTESIHWLANNLSTIPSSSSDDIRNIMDQIALLDGDFLCTNLDSGALYIGGSGDSGLQLSDAQRETFSVLEGAGIREPFLNDYSGVWTLGYYECFTFFDGKSGYVQRSLPLNDVSERFSLSFYGNTGFSYVVNSEGDILMRSLHPNSNRTFRNLFDIIDLQDNDDDSVQSFKNSISKGERGVARFQYQGENYVFCYIPLSSSPGWSLVSIIPGRVITEQSDSIMQQSQFFFIMVAACALALVTFFAIYRSSTRRTLRAEEDARKAAEQANIAKSRFLSNMSHDIRTPMNTIIGMAQLASDHAEEPERVRFYLKGIGQAGQLLIGLINDILDMSKIESGKMTLHNEDESMEELLTNLVNMIRTSAAKKRQHLDVRLHHVQHELLHFDALRMNQVLINLLSNAVKFTPEGGRIVLDVTESAAEQSDRVHFTFRVTDTGIGMKPEFLDHVFDSFVREQDSCINKIEGSGLGLAITKLIVDMMGGSLSVESTLGEGSIFTVDVDMLLPENLDSDETLPPLRVLAADDDATVRHAVEEFLCAVGASVDTAADGPSVVAKAVDAHDAGKNYDLVLLDWNLPEQNGIETARELRGKIGKAPAIVMITSYDFYGRENEAEEAGVNGLIKKPIFRSTLLDCIHQHVLRDSQSVQKQNSEDLSGRRILVAEDNQLNQMIVREMLSKFGIQVELAENGQVCIDCFSQSTPGTYDLILMDVHMPSMDGYEATRCIRAMTRTDAGVPILAMTADAFTEDIEMAKQAGMNGHLSKPLDLQHMMHEIRQHLGK